MKKKFAIAIDGPAGAGKSTIAKKLAEELHIFYLDTGAIYRAVGYHIQLCGIGPKDVDGVNRLIDDANVEVRYLETGEQRMILNGMDVTDELRSPEMSDYASKVSAIPAVRAYLLDLQREIANQYNVIMDGRDIGTVVLPNAAVKIFLTASPAVRAKRRLLDLRAKGNKKITEAKVLEDIQARDKRDSERAIAPLKQADDADLIDTSNLTIEETVAAIRDIIRKKIAL